MRRFVGVEVESGVVALCAAFSTEGGAADESPSADADRSIAPVAAAAAFFLFDRGVVPFFFSPPVLLLLRDLFGRVSDAIVDGDLSSLDDPLLNRRKRCLER